MLPPNTILRDRYRIISELGHGGMGTVYQAMDENLNCIVAVKETLAPWVSQTTAKSHVIRGGAHFNTPEYLTSARRGWRDPEKPDFPGDHVGFRLAATTRTQR